MALPQGLRPGGEFGLCERFVAPIAMKNRFDHVVQRRPSLRIRQVKWTKGKSTFLPIRQKGIGHGDDFAVFRAVGGPVGGDAARAKLFHPWAVVRLIAPFTRKEGMAFAGGDKPVRQKGGALQGAGPGAWKRHA